MSRCRFSSSLARFLDLCACPFWPLSRPPFYISAILVCLIQGSTQLILKGDPKGKKPAQPAYVEHNADRLLLKHAKLIQANEDSIKAKQREESTASSSTGNTLTIEQQRQAHQNRIASTAMQALGWHAAGIKLRVAEREAAAKEAASKAGKRPAALSEKKVSFKRQSTMDRTESEIHPTT
jgi:hypothetical protein